MNAEIAWTQLSAQPPNSLSVWLWGFGHLRLDLAVIKGTLVGAAIHRFSRLRKRLPSLDERRSIEQQCADRVRKQADRINLRILTAGKASAKDQLVPQQHAAAILRDLTRLVTFAPGRPRRIDEHLVRTDYKLATAALAPLVATLAKVRNPETAWRWLTSHSPALAAEVQRLGLKAEWFAVTNRPRLEKMAAQLISPRHPNARLSTLMRYGRRKA